MREAALIILLIIMGYSVFGSNKVFRNSTEITPNYIEESYSKTNLNLAQELRSIDTICTSISRDTFSIRPSEKATNYSWSLPAGAFLFKKISDTAIIVDWKNATIGIGNICVAAENSCGTSSNSCIEVFIDNCNTKPIATDDIEITSINAPKTIHVQTNDFDADGDELTTLLDSTFAPSNGTLSIVKLAILYTPDAGYTGVDSFQYIICDNNHPSLCDTARVTITVDHQIPIALDDRVSTTANTSILIPVQNNDNDPDGGILTTFLDSLDLPLNGQVRIDGQDIIYIPNQNFTGIDRFDYIVCDDGNPIKCTEATITIIVTNTSPISNNDTVNTTINIPISINVQLNDIDIEDGRLTTIIDSTNLPMNGVVSLDGNNIIYTPTVGFNGMDQFNYIVCDNGNPTLCDTSSVIVTIGNTNPIAVNDSVSISSNTPIVIDVLNNDLDLDGGQLTVTIDSTNLPINGLVTIENNEIIFTPITGFTGLDSIAYIVCDDGIPSLCDSAWIYIEVGNSEPIATADTATTISNTSIQILVQENDFDPEGGLLITLIDSLKLPLNGQLTLIGTDLIYLPNLNFTGTDRFDYILCDDGIPQACSQATVTVIVKNLAPFALNDTIATDINNRIEIAVLANDSDPENGTLTISLDTTNSPLNGLILLEGNNIIYTPFENYNGLDHFQYVICDNGNPILCDTAMVQINVINSQPNAVNDTVSLTSNTPVTISVLNNDIDPDGGILTVTIDSTMLPLNGLVTVENNEIIFTPIPSFTGIDSISYIVCDDAIPSLCDTAIVFIEVKNIKPNAVDDFAKTTINTPVTIAILSNDFDPESGVLSVTIDRNNQPEYGTIVITNTTTNSGNQNEASQEGNYLIIYTPTERYIGLDSFVYILCDDGNPILCDSATVTIEIFNDAPVAVDDYIVTQEGNPITSSVLLNDFDPNDDPLSTQLLSNPTKGDVKLDNGQYTYTPYFYENGRDSFRYVLCEAIEPFQCDTAFVYIDIFPINNPPIAIDDINLTLENTATSGNVLTNDFDPEGDQVSIFLPIIMFPENGQVSMEENGNYTYQPDFLFVGEDRFSYKVCDDGIPSYCDTAYVIIHVISTDNNTNQAPIGVNDYFQIFVNEQFSGELIGNDIAPDGTIISINTGLITLPKNGRVEIYNTGRFDFIPEEDRVGTETFEYEICNVDAPDLCDTVLVEIEILPNFGNSIFAIDDAASGLEDQTIQGNILANDNDPEGDDILLNVSPIRFPINGTVTLQQNGDFSYVPNEDYNGPDNFIYEICDNATPMACDRATVNLVVFPVLDTLCNVAITPPSIAGASTVCENDSVFLFIQTDAGPLTVEDLDTEVEYIWFNGLGDTIIITNQKQLILEVSPLTIPPFSMKARAGFCVSPLSNLVDVEIVGIPEILIELDTNNDTLCANTSFELIAPFVDGVRYEWSVGGDPTVISEGQNLIVEEGITESRTYQLSLISEVCESISITTKKVNVFTNARDHNLPSVSLQSNGTCGDYTLLLNANLPDSSDTYQVNWTGPNNYTSFMAIDSIESPTTAANGQYTLVLMDEHTCEITSNITVSTVTPSVTKPIITSAEGPVCENGNILLQASSYEGLEDAYSWYKNGTIVANANSNQLFIDDAQLKDSFTVAITLENCALESNVFAPIIFEKPSVSLDSAFQLFCSSGTEEIALATEMEGGQTPYVIQWVGPNNFFSTNPNPTIINASAVNAGTYTVTVRDQNDCIADASTSVDIIDRLPTPIITLSGGICDGEQITLSVTNYEGQEVSYEWSVSNETGISSLSTSSIRIPVDNTYRGGYVLTTNSGTCTAQSDTFYIEQFNILSANPSAIYESTESCAAANLELFANATGSNLIYQWTGPNGFTSNLMNPVITNATTENNGIYEVTISSPQGCSIVAATNIIDNIQNGFPEPVLQPSGLTCAGGFITLTAPIYAGNSVSYTWFENGNPIANENSPVLVAGPIQENGTQYELVVQVESCTLRSDPYFADVIEEIELQINYNLSSNCGAASLELFADVDLNVENFNFSWTGPNGFTAAAEVATISNPKPTNNGVYTLKISNESGCESSANLIIDNIIAAPEVPTIRLITGTCETDTQLIVENEVADGNYTWTNATGIIIGNGARLEINNTTVDAGPYQVAISKEGCEPISSLPFQIESVEESIIQIGNSGPICNGTDATLFATNLEGYNYEWYNDKDELIATESSTTIRSLETATTYTLVVTKSGCTNGRVQQTEVLIKEIPEIRNITKSEIYCEGETIFLSAQNQNPIGEMIQYTWTGPNGFSYIEETNSDSFNLILPSINIGQAGSYSLQIKTANGCSSAANSVLINVIPGINTPTLEVAQNVLCAGSTLTLEARSTTVTAIAYEWYLQEDSTSASLIATTDVPNYVIENATSNNSGIYIVKAVNEQCASNFSNQVPITVFDINTDLNITSSATENKPGCYGDVLQLSLPLYETATYRWFGPAGFTSAAYNPIVESMSAIHEGEYFAIVQMDGCQEIKTSPISVVINPKPATPTMISSAPICKGGDLEFEVSSIIENSSTIRFDWFNEDDILIASTDTPERLFNNVPTSFSGQYYLEIVADGCTSEPSPSIDVQINDPANVQAYAGEDQEFCATANITLAATPPLFGQGKWSAIGGANFANIDIATTEVSQLQKGNNQFIWTVEDPVCAVQTADTVNIFVGNITPDQAIAGLDQDLCEEYSTQLIATSLTASTGRWTQSAAQAQQGIQITNPNNPQTAINGLEAGNSYSFSWTISQAECPDFETDELTINVNDIPEEYAIIQEDLMYLCGESSTNLDAELPGLSVGQWSYLLNADSNSIPAIEPIKIAAATNPSTFVDGLPLGENTFVWSLSNGACKDFSTDTIQIINALPLIANPDNHIINVNDSLAIDILSNDQFDPEKPFNLIITKYPDFGELIENENGTYRYQPVNNYFGRDNFRYQLCDPNCETLCDTAVVNLVINGVEGSGACFIPNVISPNKDGNNDIFKVACIDDWPDNQLNIFNRWGDKVYSAAPYRNDWEGTYQGQDLPAGTYFYLLQLSEGGEPLQGFITIFR